MSNSRYLTMPERFASILIAIVFWSCNTAQNEKPARELVFEGMSKKELRIVLGEPLEIDSSGVIYDVLKNKKIKIDRWKYDQRTVVLINDTVSSANENIN